MTGICISIKMRWGFQLSQIAIASRPFSASLTQKPIEVNNATNTRRLSKRSSTTKMRYSDWFGAKLITLRLGWVIGTSVVSASMIWISKAKVVPPPNTLLTWISPPINCTNLRLMGKPNPVPCWDFRPDSVCPNGSNNKAISSAAIPGPVSSTSNNKRE